MLRLNQSTMDRLASGVRAPRYDRRNLQIGMAHIGVGAFHRCHQAEYTDDMLEQQFGDWGVVGINLRPPALCAYLGMQDGLFSRTLRRGNEGEVRVIGCIRRIVDGIPDTAAAIEALIPSSLTVATMTVTEKGYCHIPASGYLDETHPDVLHDLANLEHPRSVVGLLAAALQRRRLTHGVGMTLISCDNIPSNGSVLKRVLTQFAEACDPALASWLRDEVIFPSTMVDRIVPAIQEEDLKRASAACGLEDRAGVVGEPFRQWVIENEFHGGRPAWDLAGATFVTDVQPYELVKMRLLNAAQSAWAYFGALCGHEFTFESVRDPVLGPLVLRMLNEESATTVPDIPGMQRQAYIPQVFERVANEAIRHSNHQVATDGSQKIVQRVLNPIRDRLTAGQGFGLLALAVAGWMAYLLSAAPRFGARWTVADPWAETVARIAAAPGDCAAIVREIVRIEPIFGSDLQDGPFCDAVTLHLEGLLSPAPKRYLERISEGRAA